MIRWMLKHTWDIFFHIKYTTCCHIKRYLRCFSCLTSQLFSVIHHLYSCHYHVYWNVWFSISIVFSVCSVVIKWLIWSLIDYFNESDFVVAINKCVRGTLFWKWTSYHFNEWWSFFGEFQVDWCDIIKWENPSHFLRWLKSRTNTFLAT